MMKRSTKHKMNRIEKKGHDKKEFTMTKKKKIKMAEEDQANEKRKSNYQNMAVV